MSRASDPYFYRFSDCKGKVIIQNFNCVPVNLGHERNKHNGNNGNDGANENGQSL